MCKKNFFAAVLFCFFGLLSFCQEQENPEFPETGVDEDLELLLGQESSFQKFNPEIQKTLAITGIDSQLNLNPHTSSYSFESQVLNGLYEGLFTYNEKTLASENALAESYYISRNKKRWTFRIRDNAFYSNGKKITALEIKMSWLKLQKTPGAPYASLLDCIQGIKEYREGKITEEEVGIKSDGQKLTVILKSPASHLPSLLCHHAFGAVPDEEGVYSGPFTIQEKSEDCLIMKKNERYWDRENVALPEIKIFFSTDEKENSWAFNSGKVDWVLTAFDSSILINKKALNLTPLFGTSYLFFTCKNPVWENVLFRQALLAAVPWDKLRWGNLIPATTFIYPLMGYPKVNGYSQTDLEEAKDLMQEARKNSGIPEDKILELKMGIADTEYAKKQAQILMDAWESLGVKLIPFKIESSRYYADIPYLNYDIFSNSWIGDFADPLAFLELFRENSTLKQTEWKNDEFEKLVAQAEETEDFSSRYQFLSKAEQILLDDGVVIPVSHNLSFQIINLEEIGGWHSNALDIHPLKNLYFKEKSSAEITNVVMAE